MARQNKRNKSSDGEKNGKKLPSDGSVTASQPKTTIYVQLLLDDPFLKQHAKELKENWMQLTGWEEDPEKDSKSIVLLSVDIVSIFQLHVVQDILGSALSYNNESFEASCRLQMENNTTGNKSLRLILNYTTTMQQQFAKLCNDIQLRLASHSIQSSNRFDPKGLKKLRGNILWSLDQTASFPLLQDGIAETNRRGWNRHLSLRSLALCGTHTLDIVHSTWTSNPSLSHPETDHSIFHSLLLRHLSFDSNIVVIMRGQPGSGKSTLTRIVTEMASFHNREVVVCSADLYFYGPMGYHHERSLITEAHAACKSSFHAAIEQCSPVIVVDNTHSCLWEYEAYRADAIAAGYRVYVLEVECPDTSTAMRMGLRNSHGVGLDVIIRMNQRWESHNIINPEVESHLLVPPTFTSDDNRRALPLMLYGDISNVYIAAIYFQEETRKKLLERFPPKHERVIAEHMTLAFQPTKEFVGGLQLGQEVILRVVEERYDALGHCLKLEWVANVVEVDDIGQRILHTTISFPEHSAAFYSNTLLANDETSTIVPVVEPMIISGRVGAALLSPMIPKWRRAQLSEITKCTSEKSATNHVVLIYAAQNTPIDLLVMEMERVSISGSIHILATIDASLHSKFQERSIHFHHSIVSNDLSIVYSISFLVSRVPDVDSIDIITTQDITIPEIQNVQKIAIHNVGMYPSTLASGPSFHFRQFLGDIQHFVEQAWRNIADETFVSANAQVHYKNHFDIYLETNGLTPLANLSTRLVEALRHHRFELQHRRSSTSDQVDILDVIATRCYSIHFRVVLFIRDHQHELPIVQSNLSLLSQHRPATHTIPYQVFHSILDSTQLPFCDFIRSNRALSSILADGFVKLFPKDAVSMDQVRRVITPWSETDWLVLLSQNDYDPIKLALSFHSHLVHTPVDHSPEVLKELELQIVRGVRGGLDDSTFEWFRIIEWTYSSCWAHEDLVLIRHLLWHQRPKEILFRRTNEIGISKHSIQTFLASSSVNTSEIRILLHQLATESLIEYYMTPI